MSPAELAELAGLLRAVFALLMIQAPVLAWVAIVLWKLDRRLYRVELELVLADKQ